MPTMLATSADVSGGEMIREATSNGKKPAALPCVYVGRAARVCVSAITEDVKNVCANSSGLKTLTLGLGAE